jgi:hypothetical protein
VKDKFIVILLDTAIETRTELLIRMDADGYDLIAVDNFFHYFKAR